MPFTSEKQMKYMFSVHPKIAKKMAKKQEKKQGKGVFKKLPKRAKDDLSLDMISIQDMEPIK
jgi:hypothetical protein